jgi:hypothetical protein
MTLSTSAVAGLLLQRFAQLIEQTHVLDGDAGLVGKSLEKRDLLVVKEPDFGPSELNRSDRYPLAHHRNTKGRSVTQPFRKGAPFGKLLCLSLEVKHMDSLAINDGAASDASTRAMHSEADFLRKWTPVGGGTKLVPVALKNGHVVGSAEARRIFDDNIQHGLELGR